MHTLPQIHLLFGFLGAGKTTLVRNLLQAADSEIPTAVIVNEFGDVGIDGDIIQGNTIDTIELVSGCICCTLKGSLMNAIEELVNDKGAKRIVVEATGVADPEDMLDDLEDSSVTDTLDVAPIVAVVDCASFNKIRPMLGEFYVSQILNADIVIINKIDRTDTDQLEAVAEQIKEINPWAEIRFTEYCDVDSSLIFTDEVSALLDRHESKSNGHDHHHAHELMESLVIVPHDNLTRSKVDEIVAELPETVWRMKGHMLIEDQPSLVQYAAGQLEICDADPKSHYRMVLIGQALETEATHVATRLGNLITTTAK